MVEGPMNGTRYKRQEDMKTPRRPQLIISIKSSRSPNAPDSRSRHLVAEDLEEAMHGLLSSALETLTVM